MSTKPLQFSIQGTCGRARATTLRLPHGDVPTPVFMPVGTKGTIKGLTVEQLQLLKPSSPPIILGNTYHLALHPGTKLLRELTNGLHGFMRWPKPLLTDSGGFQMVSLLKLAEITEEGVKFQDPDYADDFNQNKKKKNNNNDKKKDNDDDDDDHTLLLTPEMSIEHQNNIGADIIMQLDDVVSSVTDNEERFIEATDRSIRWLDRCIAAHSRPEEQNLFPIIQGGLDVSPNGLREHCLEEMIKRDLNGYAIGGLAGGEDKEQFWRVVELCTRKLPHNKPRYLMGVGYPLDIVVCVALGVDMFDCVYPTRTARFGVALVDEGTLRLKLNQFNNDTRPIESNCQCETCQNYTRAHLYQLLKEGGLAGELITIHNISYMQRLTNNLREAIINNTLNEFINNFLNQQFPDHNIPQWVIDALNSVNIEV